MISDGLITYSPKVFIPLTKLCRNVCHYCTFAQPPKQGETAYLTSDDVLTIAPLGSRRRVYWRPCSRWATSRSFATRRHAKS